jgi:hypothetical protein
VTQNATQIKTEAAAVYHTENEIVESNNLTGDQGDYEYDQSYQDDNTTYQRQEQDMHMAQAVDNLQGAMCKRRFLFFQKAMICLIRRSSYSIFLFSDPYADIKEYVVKVPNENGFSCTICGKKCRDMYLMRAY